MIFSSEFRLLIFHPSANQRVASWKLRNRVENILGLIFEHQIHVLPRIFEKIPKKSILGKLLGFLHGTFDFLGKNCAS